MDAARDQELIRKFQDGDQASFNELVRAYQEKIYWVARRFVNDHDQADEIVQEVFIKIYKALSTFRSDSSFYTWIYRITVNVSLNELRRQRVKDFFRIDEFYELEDTNNERPDEAVERSEQQEILQRAIALLPEKQKAVFLLRYYDELPYEEISKILKTSVGGLKANYFHAVKKLGAYLHRENETR
jgi:RNA polymerase sigma-70 factor (ECF subfamily)